MRLLSILGNAKLAPAAVPEFIREIEDIRGVRVIRLRGSVGKEIGAQAAVVDKAAAETEGAFTRPLLFDFAGTTGWDFATISYMIIALRRRMAAHAKVGMINASPELVGELDIARLEGLLRVFTSEDQALAELSEPLSGFLEA